MLLLVGDDRAHPVIASIDKITSDSHVFCFVVPRHILLFEVVDLFSSVFDSSSFNGNGDSFVIGRLSDPFLVFKVTTRT